MSNGREKVSVLALGSWGTALSNHLAKKGHDVLAWTIEQDVVDSINSNHKHPRCFPDINVHPDLKATNDLQEALSRSIVVMSFPSSALKDVIPKLKDSSVSIIVSALKGIEAETLKTPLQYAADYCPPSMQRVVLSGPSFAVDLINSRPLGLLAASEKEETARKVAELFSASHLKVYLSTDPLGVELGGIVKNVIAIAAGVCDGLNCGDSARAGLITRGLAEMTRLAEALGAKPQTLFGLSGLGDLVMTASCDTSRNRTVGLRLGRGEDLQSILSSLGAVAEGVVTTPLIQKLAEKYKVDMPITTQVAGILSGATSIAEAAQALLSRPMRREF